VSGDGVSVKGVGVFMLGMADKLESVNKVSYLGDILGRVVVLREHLEQE